LAKDLVEIINHEKLKNIDFLKFSGLKKTPFKKITSINSKYDLHLLAYGPLDAAAYRISKSAARILIPFCMKIAIYIFVS